MDEKLDILVIEDSVTVRTMIADALKELGYTVHQSELAEGGDIVLNNEKIRILFLDLRLPGMNGLDYLDKIRKAHEDLIVIVMTGYESTETAVKAIEKGAYDYVIKPIEAKHIELIVKRALKRYEIEQKRKTAESERIRMEELLKEKISDLEKINKVAVAREMRMIELKRKVLELEKQLKEKQ